MSISENQPPVKQGSIAPLSKGDELKIVLQSIIQEEDKHHCLTFFTNGSSDGVEAVSIKTIDKAIKEIENKSSRSDIYITLNPLVPPKDWRKPWSGVDGSPKTPDVLRRRHILIDVDQDDTEEGKKQTLPERIEAAQAVAEEIEAFIAHEFGRTIGRSFLGCSGRGAQLWIRCDIDAISTNTKKVEKFIELLGSMFNRDGVHIDTGVNDLRRVARVCADGLFNYKGGVSFHRWPCKLLKASEDGYRLTIEDLDGFIEKYDNPSPGLEVASQPSVHRTEKSLHASTAPRSNDEARVKGIMNWCCKQIEAATYGNRRKSFQRALKHMAGLLSGHSVQHMEAEVISALSVALQSVRPETTEADRLRMISDIWDPNLATPITILGDHAPQQPVKAATQRHTHNPTQQADDSVTSGVFFPKAINEAAFIGPIGKYAKLVYPSTEASLENLLVTALVAFGNALGRSSYYQVEASRHYTNEFLLIVGRTAKARKGTGLGRARELLRELDEEWSMDCIKTGLTSGEGLIHNVRDEKRKNEPIKEHGRVTGYQEVIVDEGVSDKRLLAIEEEFSRVMKTAKREDNILSDVIREAWDSRTLQNLGKKSGEKASDPHISIIGQITREEFNVVLQSTDAFNGFLNRFLVCAVRRSKHLPTGGPPIDQNEYGNIIYELQEAIRAAKEKPQQIALTSEAQTVWAGLYQVLSREKDGILGYATARAEAHVIRLSLLYALTERSSSIELRHLQAALAVWSFCESSVEWLFQKQGDEVTNDPLIIALVKAKENGLERSKISKNVYHSNKTAQELDHILLKYDEQQIIKRHKVKRPGAAKSVEVWYLTEHYPTEPPKL